MKLRGMVLVMLGSVKAFAAETPPGAGEVATATGDYASQPTGDYASRQKAFLEHAAAANPSGLYSQVARLTLDRPLNEDAIRAGLGTVGARRDGADFVANGLLRIYSSKSKLLSSSLRTEIKAALLGMKYWVDEPGGKDLLSMWSENHQINYHAAEYLAGQFFPKDLFTNNGKDGRWHQAAAKKRILKWIEVKARTGFTEWDSNNCYMNTMAALLNLAELAADHEVASRAAMLLDVMFFDMAVDSFRGTYGTSHGRTSPKTVLAGGTGEDTTGMQRIAFGMGSLGKPDSAASNYLAVDRRYKVSPVIQAIGQHLPAELENRERQSLTVEDAPRLGLDFGKTDDFFLLKAGGQFATPEKTQKTLAMMKRVNVPRWGLVMRPWAEAVGATYDELRKQGRPLVDLDNSSLATVDKYTYRTPDYQLSTAQDYRKGLPGSQQYIWQATLGPSTLVTTIHPGPTPKYWQGRLPRTAQYKNVLIAFYDIPSEHLPGPRTIVPPEAGGDAMPSPAPSEESLDPRTLAVFRRSSFDEVVGSGNWTFGRKGQAYVALWSATMVHWTNGVFGGEGLVAPRRRNAWICQMGRQSVDGPFAEWTKKIAAAKLAGTESAVEYAAPGIGEVAFAWDGPFTVNGKVIPLHGYNRFDNPYAKVPWGQGRYEISHAGRKLVLDFGRGR
jgi:hypothetical protein